MRLFANFARNNIPPLLVQVISTFGMIPMIFSLLLSPNLKKIHGNLKWGVFFSVLVGVLSATAAIAQYTSFSKGGLASIVIPIISLAALITLILARFVFKDKPNKYQYLGIALSMVAIVLFNITPGQPELQSTGMPILKSLLSPWMLWAILSLFCAGTAQLFIKSATNYISAYLLTVIVVGVTLGLSVVLIATQSF